MTTDVKTPDPLRDTIQDGARAASTAWWGLLALGTLWIWFGMFVLSYQVGSLAAVATVRRRGVPVRWHHAVRGGHPGAARNALASRLTAVLARSLSFHTCAAVKATNRAKSMKLRTAGIRPR